MTRSSTIWGLWPGKSVRIMTCVSVRSGTASSGVRSTAIHPATASAAQRTSTMSWFEIDHEISFAMADFEGSRPPRSWGILSDMIVLYRLPAEGSAGSGCERTVSISAMGSGQFTASAGLSPYGLLGSPPSWSQSRPVLVSLNRVRPASR